MLLAALNRGFRVKMTVYTIDPLADERWPQFVDRRPDSSVFHSRGWLEALKHTYGYEPVVYSTSGPSEPLENGVPFCRVKSWLTGKRLVSLPFSDHCQPLVSSSEHLGEILRVAEEDSNGGAMKYVELRPLSSEPAVYQGQAYGEGSEFYFHALDLTKSLDDIHGSFHKTAIQQMIRRAERENLVLDEGRSDEHLKMFYDMLLMTRRKHQVPPQPMEWFRNVLECLGDHAKIRVALHEGVPTAAILTASHNLIHYYKYGCSDARFSKLGGTPFLIWEAIKDAREQGATMFDMGRSDTSNAGLVSFKSRWGAEQSQISYYRYPAPSPSESSEGWKMHLAKQVFSRLPNSMMAVAGKAMYRHVG